eukprot:6197284-Pleurochrysis_carterae.AAC.1
METWSKSRTRVAREHQASYSLEDGILKRGTKYEWRIVVPRQKCFDLVRATHRLLETSGHRGAAALASQLRRNLYWDSMFTHCEQICQHCQLSRGRDTPSVGGHVATGVAQDPPFSFHTISIDHKAATASRATGYQYILVVVDMRTRFATAIPTKIISVEDTISGLAMEHVFTKHFFPLVIKSDNGIAFRNELMACFPKETDFRNAYVLLYNAHTDKRYGGAERWSHYTFLGKAYSAFRYWPSTLPIVTFALNCTEHVSLGTSPFFASYVRGLNSLLELKHPNLFEVIPRPDTSLWNHWHSNYVKHGLLCVIFLCRFAPMQLPTRILTINGGCDRIHSTRWEAYRWETRCCYDMTVRNTLICSRSMDTPPCVLSELLRLCRNIMHYMWMRVARAFSQL